MATAHARPSAGWGARFLRALPTGDTLAEDAWRTRHAGILALIGVHVVVIPVFALVRGFDWQHALVETSPVAAFGLAALFWRGSRTVRASFSGLALITSSAVFTHLSGGYIEAHFHFFVMMSVIALYQEWVPFLLSVGYVAVHHGVVGVLDPASVFNHADAFVHPWKWAGIHAGFIAFACAVNVVAWKFNELARADAEILLEAVGEGIAGTDTDGRVTFWNPMAETLTGRRARDVVGRPLAEVLPVVADLGDAVRMREGTLRAADGREVPVDVVWTPVNDRGVVTGAVVSFQDVSARKAAEAEIHELNRDLERRIALRTRELEAAYKELEAFSYSVSHDLRAPLRSIDGFSRAVIDDFGDGLDDKAKEYLGRVRDNTQRMAGLIDDLLQLSRITRAEVRKDRIDLSTMVNVLADDIRKRQPERKVEIAVPAGVKANADPRLLGIALTNLLDNAWKYTSKHPEAHVEFGVEEVDGERVYHVKDDGAGFDPAYAHKLFTAFQRLHSTSDFEGTGVGLATVARVVQRHGGRIWAEGAPEKGATFYFTLGEKTA